MKNIIKIRNNRNDEVIAGLDIFVFNEIYAGLFNFYFNPGSDGSYISSYFSQDYGEYFFTYSAGDSNVIEIGFNGNYDYDDFVFNEKITTQINQALWSNPGGGIVDITNLPVMKEYDLLAQYMEQTNL
tara:strand:+ start:1029 stop:1412 length:384 start_codon:yes stop_codon:yes gene_type:complete